MVSDKTMNYGEALTVALLGVDALYRQEPAGAGEGLVVVNMAASTHQPQAFAGYADATACFEDLRRRGADLPEPHRRQYYDQVCALHTGLYRLAGATAAVRRPTGRFPARARSPGRGCRPGCNPCSSQGLAEPYGL